MRRLTRLTLLPIAALTMAACSSDTDVVAPDTEPTVNETADDEALRGVAAGVGGPFGELRDGVWRVGPAGEVEFRVVEDNTLELVRVTPAEGWTVTDEDVDPDEFEVDFRRGPVEFEIEVEIEAGVLEIEIDQDIDPAEPGVFGIGEAATVEVLVEDGRLVLGEITVHDGWSETDRSVSDDDIDIEFSRGAGDAVETGELDADLDDGELEIEIDYEIEGSWIG